MTIHMSDPTRKRRMRHPKIVINADDLTHIEALAEGAMQRNPALADRLLSELGRARIVKAQKMPTTAIGIGSTASYIDGTTGQERRVTLVYPEQADIARNRISLMTPIGVALLGLSEGDSFYWDTRDNQRRMLTVTRVEQAAADDPEAN
ncbi:nucleoside diphosphate kinase regulator [Antarcticimicrobium sediminis]|uniref:Nucleoside diphosphate kinase regulator n=1 Tax=Antarcticimicrobium sediminis TaxID=2546227 RepID=A0A4R5EFP8_9RHOB|nr:nucleoside diphosphate kinase regulator [Antarcticimicrobium sediminis]TDE33063.1 nucleoside diphosphate kinase regulator [Antarcticimicrobium sediminis]